LDLTKLASGSSVSNGMKSTVEGRDASQDDRNADRKSAHPEARGTEAVPARPSAPKPENYTSPERKWLLDIARKTLASVETHPNSPEPVVNAKDVPPRLTEIKACFVTLTKHGAVRGCIGHLEAREPLYAAVMHNARDVVLYDPRFRPGELDKIKIEISVLTDLQPLPFTSPEDLLDRLKPEEDGVVLQIGSRRATFLPRVWEQIPDKVEFLNHLSQKAGCAPSAWRGKDTSVSIYQAECFEEAE
jgi:AmmeMemoRadiSam system protein A